jgi:hypothetical protein
MAFTVVDADTGKVNGAVYCLVLPPTVVEGVVPSVV